MRYCAGAGLVLLAAAAVHAQSTICVSVPPWLPIHGDAAAAWASISRNGRFVAFISESPALVPGDTNDREDVFVFDLETGQYERAGFDIAGQQLYSAEGSAISDNGRFVAYYAHTNDPSPAGAMVHDRLSGANVFVNKRSDGTLAPETQYFINRIAISGTGRFVAFHSVANMMGDAGDAVRQIYVHDRDADGNRVFDEAGGIKTIRVSVSTAGVPSNGESRYPDISPDGRFVTFSSFGSNLVEPDVNGDRDVFVHDRDPDRNGIFDEPGHILTERVSVASDGQQALGRNTYWSSISADGRYVVFHSPAANLIPGDTNGKSDVFLHDRQTHETLRISTAWDGSQSNGSAGLPEITDDGRFIVYQTSGTDVFAGSSGESGGGMVLFDRLSRSKKRVAYTYQNAPSINGGGGDITAAACLSPDARLVVFVSTGDDLVSYHAYPPSVFLRDRGPHYLADVDGAGTVNVSDLLAVIAQWGPCPSAPAPCPADLDADGSVNVGDLLMVIANWG